MVCRSVHKDCEPCKTAEAIMMLFGMWTRVEPKKVESRSPTETGGGGIVALMSGFPRMLSTSVPTGRTQKLLCVRLNFPNEKSHAMRPLVKIS